MADLQHKDLPNSQLHEPKGVSAANAGEIYTANGAGSGAWDSLDGASTGVAPAGALLIADGATGADFLRYQGWSQYEDSRTTVGTPTQTITNSVRTKIINDGGTLTLEKAPSDATVPLWNVSTNKHMPVAAFDLYHLRLSFTIEDYSGTDPYIDVELDIGGSVGTIFARDITLRKGGAAQKVSLAFPVFSGTTYLANGGEFYITYTGNTTCKVYKTSILIIRESKNYV